MNKKAEGLLNFFDEKKIDCFQVEEIQNDAMHTVAFRSNIEVEGQQLPTVIIVDDTIYTVIRVRVAAAALKDEKKAELLGAINEINGHYKVFKYYFASNGDLILDSVLVSPADHIDGEMVYAIVDVIVRHFNDEYRNIMKQIWS